MTSAKPYDFLSELKATLSKLTAHNESDAADVNENSTEHAVQSTSSQNVDHHQQHHAELVSQTAGLCQRGVLYGELSTVLEKRGQQQLSDEQTASRVIELESRLRPGKSIVYLGSHRQTRNNAVTSAVSDVTTDAALTLSLIHISEPTRPY